MNPALGTLRVWGTHSAPLANWQDAALRVAGRVARWGMNPAFQKPSAVDRFFNSLFGGIVALGGGLSHNRLLQVRGRKSGKVYSTPVNLLEHEGKLWLVAPRGRAQWTRNAEAAGEVALKKGSQLKRYRIRAAEANERPAVIRHYLEAFATTVQRYFTSVRPDSPLEAFSTPEADRPVYELTELDN